MKNTLMLFVAAASLALAQPPAATFDNVTVYLGLGGDQLTSFAAIRTAEKAALDPLMQQMEAARKKVHDDVESGAPTLALDRQAVKDLEAKIDATRATYIGQSTALLTAAQRSKLAALDPAAKLGPTIHEAAGLNLLVPPARPDGPPVGREGPGGFGRARGPQRPPAE